MEALNRLGYDAVALGEQDLRLGKDELRKRLGEAKTFTFLSANLIDKGTGELFAQPFVIKQIGGHQVAVIGITAETPTSQAEFAVTPASEALRSTVQQVRSKADVIILLSNAGAEANKRLAAEVPELDLIVSGGTNPLPQPVRTGEGALVAQADLSSPGNGGRNLGILKMVFDRSGKLSEHMWESITLNSSVAEDPDMAAWIESLPRP